MSFLYASVAAWVPASEGYGLGGHVLGTSEAAEVEEGLDDCFALSVTKWVTRRRFEKSCERLQMQASKIKIGLDVRRPSVGLDPARLTKAVRYIFTAMYRRKPRLAQSMPTISWKFRYAS